MEFCFRVLLEPEVGAALACPVEVPVEVLVDGTLAIEETVRLRCRARNQTLTLLYEDFDGSGQVRHRTPLSYPIPLAAWAAIVHWTLRHLGSYHGVAIGRG